MLEQILDLWYEVTGMDPNSRDIHFSWGQDFSLDECREELRSAFSLDETGLTALYLLRHFLQEYKKSRKFSLGELMGDLDSIHLYLEKAHRLETLLNDEAITSVINGFNNALSKTCETLTEKNPDSMTRLKEMLANDGDMGYLRRDALKSMETLRVYQFTQGEPSSTRIHPSRDIFLFWNMASAVRLGLQLEDGVFMSLIKDPFDTASFFAILAKNGGNLTVFTDAPKFAHPMSKYMSRNPGREMSRRIAKHHFPYGLLDLTFNYKGDAFVSREGMVPLQTKPIVVGHLDTIEPDEVLWTLMVYSLIDNKLYKNNWKLDELAYCADVLREESELAETLRNLPAVSGYKPLELKRNTLIDLDRDMQYRKITTTGFLPENLPISNSPNAWIVEKFKDKISDSVINGLLIPVNQKMLSDGSSCTMIKSGELSAMSYFERDRFLAQNKELKGFTGDEFGTKEELEEDYRFVARYNMATVIEQNNKRYFDEHIRGVTEWITQRIEQKKDHILEEFLKGSLEGNLHTREWYSSDRYCSDNLMCQGDGYTIKNTKCFWSGKQFSYMLQIHCETKEEVKKFLDCTEEELPEPLRHWKGDRQPYTGNPILERIDPVNWIIQNHWDKIKFRYLFAISKSVLKERAAALHVDLNKFLS